MFNQKAILLGWMTLLVMGGCGKNEALLEKIKAESDKRVAGANAEVDKMIGAYVETLNANIPSADAPIPEGGETPMLTWRKDAADSGLEKTAADKSASLADTPSGIIFRDGALIFEALHDYWLGREVKGPKAKKKWEEGYEESLKVAVKKGARERISLKKHLAHLQKLSIGDSAKPWLPIVSFERILPHVLQMYKYRSYKGAMQSTSFSPYWQDAFNLPRAMLDGMPEPYQIYRDKLCKKIGKGCDVPYENRDIVIRKSYITTVLKRLKEFSSAYGAKGFKTLIARFEANLNDELKKAVVPEEYPILPDTVAPVPTSAYTVLTIGPKGALFESDNPNDLNERLKVELLPARTSWKLSPAETKKLVDGFVTEILDLKGQGGSAEYTTEVFYHFDKTVPLSVLAALGEGFERADIQLIDLVARRRIDGSKILRRVPLTVTDKEARKALPVAGAGSCMPLFSLGDFKVPPDLSKGFVVVKGNAVTAGPKGKTVARGKLNGDLSAVGKWLADFKKPSIIAVDAGLNYGDLHKIISSVAYQCKDKLCTRPKLTEKLVLAICN